MANRTEVIDVDEWDVVLTQKNERWGASVPMKQKVMSGDEQPLETVWAHKKRMYRVRSFRAVASPAV